MDLPALPPADAHNEDLPALEGELLPPGTYEKLASREPYPEPGQRGRFGYRTFRDDPLGSTRDSYREGGIPRRVSPFPIFTNSTTFFGTDFASTYGAGSDFTVAIKAVYSSLGRAQWTVKEPPPPSTE